MSHAFYAPSADPIDCEACGMVLGPVSRVIRAGGDPSREYMEIVLKGPPLRVRTVYDPLPTAEDTYAVCKTCARDLGTLEARIFARRVRHGG